MLVIERDISRKATGSAGIHASLLNAWADDPTNERGIAFEVPVRAPVDDRTIAKDFLSPPTYVTPSSSEKSSKLAGVWRIFTFLPNLWYRKGAPAIALEEAHPLLIRTYVFDAELSFLTETPDSRILAADASMALSSQPLSRWRKDLPIRVSCSQGKFDGLEVWAAKVQDQLFWVWSGERTMKLTKGTMCYKFIKDLRFS